MPFTQHELELRRRASDLIARDLLPASIPAHLWAGQGSQQPCSLCDQPIGPEEIEYELEDPQAGTERNYRFHLRCHAIWQLAVSTVSTR